MISVISVFNDNRILQDWLLGSLRTQTRPHEFVGVDNTRGTFSSAAAALNWGARKARGKYLAFIHQDVSFSGDDWLEKAEVFLQQTPALGVAGVAGMFPCPGLSVWQVGTAPVENRLGLVVSGTGRIPLRCRTAVTEPAAVQTLDEQVLMIPAEVFARLAFDEATCANWHLYGVDYALSAAAVGLRAYVLPLPVRHRSMGRVDERYFRTLKQIFKKHRSHKVIHTTCGSWYTRRILNCAALAIMAARAEAGRWAGRNRSGGGPSLSRLKCLVCS